MVTRFYPTDQPTIITPSYDGAWDVTTDALRRQMLLVLSHEDNVSRFDTDNGDSNDQDLLIYQWISPPLAGQDLPASTFEAVFGAREGLSTSNLVFSYVIKVVSADGSTVRGTLLALARDDTELNSVQVLSRHFTTATAALAGVQAGDHLIIEMGLGGDPSGTSRHDWEIFYNPGNTATIGEAPALDGELLSTRPPWFEFGDDFLFLGNPFLVDFTGFEAGAVVDFFATTGPGVSIQSAVKRSGNYALRLNPAADAGSADIQGWGAGDGAGSASGLIRRATETYFLIYLRVASLPLADANIIKVQDSSNNNLIALQLKTTGELLIGSNPTPIATLAAGTTWYRIDLRVTCDASTCGARVDGGSEQTATGGAGTVMKRLRLGTESGATETYDLYFDDVGIATRAFSQNKTYAALMAVPTGAGTYSSWNSGTGATFAECDEVPPDTTTYIGENTVAVNVGHTFTFQTAAAIGIVGDIASVRPCTRVREESSTTTLAAVRFRSNGADLDSDYIDSASGTTYINRHYLFAAEPQASAAWSPALFNALEAGPVKGNDASGLRCTVVYVFVWAEADTTVPPACSALSVTYGAWTRTGPLNTPWHLSFLASAGDVSPANYQIRTAASRGGTLVASGVCAVGANSVSIAYNASGLIDGDQTLYLSLDDGDTPPVVGDDCSFTLRRDDVNPTAATAIAVTA